MAILDNETTLQDADLKIRVKWVINRVAADFLDDVGRTDQDFCRNVMKEPENSYYLNQVMYAIITADGALDNAYSDGNLILAVEGVWDALSGNVSV